MRFFAHTLGDRPVDDWQGLADHLQSVASIAARNASAFGSGDWGRLAGLWHDLGKYSVAFQAYLAQSHDPHQSELHGRVDHATAGAQNAVERLGVLGHLLAFPIAGHHSGLLDSIDQGACMQARLAKQVEPWDNCPSEIIDQPPPTIPAFLAEAIGRRDAFTVSFFVRMVFSALVDADFQDTQRFMDPAKAEQRPEWPADVLSRMSHALAAYIVRLDARPTVVNRERAHVLEACRRAAQRPPGLFSLTVPTGGGKTLSSLAFALDHATQHGLDRVIYVVPFTSIIEQNVGVFREVMAPLASDGLTDPVIEHHSNLDPERETVRSRLAAENWDAPLTVTTSVQFYESLFATRSSRCRKLHNLARSVIILDEAQALPVEFLAPCLRALDELTRNYGSTVVLCTATQPAIELREDFPIGLDVKADHEIVPDRRRLFEALKRVEVVVEAEPLADEALAARIFDQGQVLCIVNTRGHAQDLAALVGPADEHFHLSALMCPAHRTEQLLRIQRRLDQGLDCRVVATRLIEAGVDVDFPVVFRSLAGLDSIAQAAGRCNRNGRLPMGRTIVFMSEHRDRERFIAATTDAARQVLDAHEDPLSLAAIEHYFRLYFWDQKHKWDAKKILDEFRLVQDRQLPFLFGYRRVARDFRLIEETGRPIIIPWGEEGEQLCAELRTSRFGPSVHLLRRLQRFTVQVPEQVWHAGLARAVELVHDQYAVLAFLDQYYSNRTGLQLKTGPTDALIA